MQFIHDNPFYDFVLIVVGQFIPSLSGYKKVLGRVFLRHRDSRRVHLFRKDLRDYLRECPEFTVPFTGRLLISLAIGLTNKEYNQRDLDNMAKSVLDALKGVVYQDDKTVAVLHVVKYSSPDNRWNIGIKQIYDTDQLWYSPWLYNETPYGSAQA